MKDKLLLITFAFGSLTTAFAQEPNVQQAQQSLHEKGFYNGPINGQSSEETTQALRRFQIRNGLKVSGQLDEGTVQALAGQAENGGQADNGTGIELKPIPPPLSTPAPLNQPKESAVVSSVQPASDTPAVSSAKPAAPAPKPAAPASKITAPLTPPTRPATHTRALPTRSGKQSPAPDLMEYFENTPYQFSPPSIQADVISRAQYVLHRRGFYRGLINVHASDEFYNALLSFQATARLPQSGKLDMPTLSKLHLLPGWRHEQYIYEPHRVFR